MVEYIRGKKAYTKWDADSENVDIEYHDGLTTRSSSNNRQWLDHPRGRCIKISLSILAVFTVGFFLGYLVRRGIHHDLLYKISSRGSSQFKYCSENSDFLKDKIRPDGIREFLINLSLKSHVAGTTAGSEVATTIQRHWERSFLDDVRLEKYLVLMSYPPENGTNSVLVLDEATKAVTANLTNRPTNSEVKPYLAYSANGNVTGKLVYANYGRREDFEMLEKSNVSADGSIVIMRLGKAHRGDKVRWAAQNGAIGVLLYPDPADYVGDRELFPEGLGLPGDAIVYGSLKTYPGDPETPGLPSIESAYRPPFGSDMGLPKIPAQPISYNDARTLLGMMAGPASPDDWIGNLNVTYHLGPGFVSPNSSEVVRLQVANELQRREISNVVGVIYGKVERDEYVIVGCHHDTWTTGASDPATGMAVLMEIVQAFGELRKTGWSPSRSLIFASWDAEEYGILGSTEWVEDHGKELMDGAVAYINIDSAVTGNYTLEALGSPLLRKALHEATAEVPGHDGQKEPANTYDLWRTRNPQAAVDPYSIPKMDVLGTGSDFVSFMAGHGIPSVHLQFINNDLDFDYPLYHTDYDIYDSIARFVDPSFNASTTLARVVAVLSLKLTDTHVLPFNCNDYVNAMEHGLALLNRRHGEFLLQHDILTDLLQRAISHFDRAAKIHYSNFAKMNGTDSMLMYHEFNHQLMQVERSFILPQGLQDNPAFRHVIFGPHVDNIHEGVIFPTIVDSVLTAERQPTEANVEKIKLRISEVVQALRSAGGMLISSAVIHYTRDSFL